MTISAILTSRKHITWPSYHLVYEWEDVISDKMNIPFCYKTNLNDICNKIVQRVQYRGNIPFQNKKMKLQFELSARMRTDIYNRKSIIPIIIDFYLSQTDLINFTNSYNRNPFILISSAEAIEFLKENNCSLNYFHFPLSLPDIYQLEGNINEKKKYDLVLAGRQNPILEKYLDEYIKTHPNFIYVYRRLESGNFFYYTNKGDFLGEYGTRAEYISLLRESKIGLYATPGIDGGELRTKGFNQVTPRFLELIASGCHVIARYPQNADTDFYQISDFSPNIDSYEKFETQIDFALNNSIDINKYSSYLKQHYTSTRVEVLKDILSHNL